MENNKIDKEQLLRALEKVKPGLANKELIEQSTSFAFIDGCVITYNDEISIRHPVPGLNIEGAIFAENLYKFLGKVKSKDLFFNIEGNEIILNSLNASAGLTLQSEIKLPLEEEIKIVGKWHLLPERFIDDISFVMTACSRDMSQPVLTCVHINKVGYVEASDGYRVARHTLTDQMPIDTILIPATSVVDMVKLKPIRVASGKGWVHFRTSEGTIISCRIFDNDEFPSTAGFFDITGTRLILPDEISDILGRAMVFAKRDHILDEEVTIIMEENKFSISANSESGWFKEEAKIDYKGNPVRFIITPYLLKGIVEKTQAGTLSDTRLKFEGSDWMYLTMLRGKGKK